MFKKTIAKLNKTLKQDKAMLTIVEAYDHAKDIETYRTEIAMIEALIRIYGGER